MKVSDFSFDLPPELIAQTPIPRRDASRLMLLDRRSTTCKHYRFTDLPGLLRPGDCLVVNDSRVLPARLFGQTGGGAGAELLLLRDVGDGVWACLTKPGKKTRKGTHLTFGGGILQGVVEGEADDGVRLIRFVCQGQGQSQGQSQGLSQGQGQGQSQGLSQGQGVFMEVLAQLGEMPLPPYIKERLRDPERYQTVYAKTPGSAAAPTAGLHFTPELLDSLRRSGILVCAITLHVGLGTFRPVKVDDLTDFKMHTEYAEISPQAAEAINAARAAGGRVVAVGTTVCRTLESFAEPDGRLAARRGETDIFIVPGYRFRAIDALITNFHLPRSTLVMLVSAFAGREFIGEAYQAAIQERYRFFSFGDAMMII